MATDGNEEKEPEEDKLDAASAAQSSSHVSDTQEEEEEEATAVDEITQGITRLSVQATSLEEQEKEAKRQMEEEWVNASASLRALASWIRDGQCRRILVLSGAGVSVAAGIPDFRTKGTGLYDNLQLYNLPYPEAVFDVNFYRRNPKPFVSLAREIWPGLKHKPTLTHSFIALLAQKGLLLRNYTQNIDGLEYLANLPTDYLVECHGHFRSASCIRCHTPADAVQVRESMVVKGKATVCEKCGFYVKPDIVFFGENLPLRFHTLLPKDKLRADLVLVLGTSLQVAPVSHIPEMVKPDCKRALLNRDLVGIFEYTTMSNSNKTSRTNQQLIYERDVFVQGDCDDNIRQLARLLGWEHEMEYMHHQAQASIQDKQQQKDKATTK